MNPMPQLTPHLKQLRLSGILDSLEIRNRQAVEQKLAYTDFLALLIEDEIARREQRKLVMRQRRAGINAQKTLESYDFTFNLGAGRLQTSTLRRRINQRDWQQAGLELRRWIYGGGRVLPGLIARRTREAELLLSLP